MPSPVTDDLSRSALEYGQTLATLRLDKDTIATRLYEYGQRPMTPALRRRLSDGTAADRFMGLDPGGSVVRGLGTGWRESDRTAHWAFFVPAGRSARASDGASFKLYVSPRPEQARALLGALCTTVRAARGLDGLKVARGFRGVVRPDKVVLYFDELEALQRLAGELRDAVAGYGAHGVAFTAPITDDRLMSWGIDPPPSATGGVPTSWRRWIVGRLAEYLVAAAVGRDRGLEPWQTAIERLRGTGVDPETWSPATLDRGISEPAWA